MLRVLVVPALSLALLVAPATVAEADGAKPVANPPTCC
jgi:hypothetical protein